MINDKWDIIVGQEYQLGAGGLERIQKTQNIIHIVLENSPYSIKKSNIYHDESYSAIVVETLKNFVDSVVAADTTGSLEFKMSTEKVERLGATMPVGWEVDLEFNIDIDTNNVSEKQIKQYIADVRKWNVGKLRMVECNKLDSFDIRCPVW